MDRPKSVVRVVREVTDGHEQSVHVSHLLVVKFWHVQNLLPHNFRLRLSVLVRY